MFDELKLKMEAKKLKKEAEKEKRKIDALEALNEVKMENSANKKELERKKKNAEFVHNHLTETELREQISKTKQQMYVVKNRLLDSLKQTSREYEFYKGEDETPVTKQKTEALESKIKNTYYALAMVYKAIDRLETMSSEYEWHETMREFANGCKAMNKLSLGSDYATRFLLWWQKTKMNMQRDNGISESEHYYSVFKETEDLAVSGKYTNDNNEKVKRRVSDALVSVPASEISCLSADELEQRIKYGSFIGANAGEFEINQQEEVNEVRNETGKGTAVKEKPVENAQQPFDYSQFPEELSSTILGSGGH